MAQRVQVVHRAGLSSSNTTGTAASLSYDGHHATPTLTGFGALTKQQSALSRLLAPPPAPHYRIEYGASLAVIVALTISSTSWCGGVVAGLAGVVLAGVLGYAIWRHSLSRDAHVRAYNHTTRAAYERAHHLWSLAMFCHRCDGVWVPGAGTIVPAAQMHAALLG